MIAKIKHLLLTTLIFNLGCLLIMAFNISGYQFTGSLLALTYVPLAFIGQAFVMSLLLLLVFLWVFWLPTKFYNMVYSLIAASALYLLAIDSWVFSIYHFHINAFFINMFFSDMAGMGIEPITLVAAIAGWLFLVIALYFLTQFVAGFSPKRVKRFKLGVVYCAVFLLTLVGQGIHAWGYAHNLKSIVSLTYTIPLYYPLIATKDIKKMGWYREDLVEENLAVNLNQGSGFNYPLAPLICPAESNLNIVVVTIESWRFDRMNAQVTPNIFAVAQNSLNFNNHLSTGTVTDKGLFGLFYGTSPAYLPSALGAGREPALVQAANAMNYQTWVIANQDIEINKLDKLFFPNNKPIQSTGIRDIPQGDIDVAYQFIRQLNERDSNKPFFSYLLFNASHFSYWTPPGYEKPFQPSERFSPSKATDATEPEPYFNQYSNAIHFIDGLMGEIIDELKKQQLWENTVLVVTGDHGEEFKDQNKAYWGHGSNFARYQSGVPLVIHWPGQAPRSYEHRTSHEDVFATLVTQALECQTEFSAISTGAHLFSNAPRTNIVESYVNQAIIKGDVVAELFPGFVKTYQLDDISVEQKASAETIADVQRVLGHFR